MVMVMILLTAGAAVRRVCSDSDSTLTPDSVKPEPRVKRPKQPLIRLILYRFSLSASDSTDARCTLFRNWFTKAH